MSDSKLMAAVRHLCRSEGFVFDELDHQAGTVVAQHGGEGDGWSNFPDPGSSVMTEGRLQEWLSATQPQVEESPGDTIANALASLVQAAEQALLFAGTRLNLEAPSVAERFRWAVENGRSLVPQKNMTRDIISV